MESLITQLINCLAQETGHYLNISILAEQQKEFLIMGNVDDLPGNIRLEEKEVFALGPLIAERSWILREIATVLGMKSITLTEAVNKAPFGIVEEFKKAVINLVDAAKNLENINRGNEKLLQNALSYVDFTLKLVADGGKGKSLFVSTVVAEEKKSSFVNKVV